MSTLPTHHQETQVTFWGGLDTIGGNIVSIQSGKYRIITDFGALAGAELSKLTQRHLTTTLLQAQQLPAIAGLYSEEQLQAQYPLESYEASDISTIVCLSHLHLDHIGGFGQLPSELPIYALEDSVVFYKQLSQLNLLPYFDVNWQTIQSEVPFEFGPFTIEFVASDHDTLGAASIFITCPDMKIVNSGDFRLSGFHPEKVLYWANKAREFQPDLFLVEGTTFSFDKSNRDDRTSVSDDISHAIHSISGVSEQGLVKDFEQLLKTHATQLVAINLYPQNIERFIRFAEVLAAAGRTLVLEVNYYQLLKSYVVDTLPIRYIDLDKVATRLALPEQDAVTLEQIKLLPQHYVVQVDYEQHHDYILDVAPGVYVHSNGVPLGSYDARYAPWLASIVAADWQFYHAHASGHARQEDLCLINYVVQAKKVVPWHTFRPAVYAEALAAWGLTTWLPAYYQVYTATDIKSED